jgi:Spy/CpxP family protein refolding chaperone
MVMSTIRTALILTGVAASTLAAQPQTNVRERSSSRAAAQVLLAHTGELELTDQQVVRLAAIARRAEARRREMRASMDSVRARFAPGRTAPADSVARRQLRERMRVDIQRLRDQQATDQRDALAVLTPAQQARAWDLASARGRDRGMRERGMRERGRERGMRRGPISGWRPGRMPRPSRES